MQLIEGARAAKGLAVIIDVFRAFSTACYASKNGAKKIIPVGDIETAYRLKRENPDYILMGERHGEIQPGFDYGNSPTHIEHTDFTGKTIVHTTSAGTQGIVNAIHADEIITGSFVNAEAIVRYIKKKQPQQVSLVCMGWNGTEHADEDTLLAEYLKNALEGRINDFDRIVKFLSDESTTGRFLDMTSRESAPEKDFDLCLDLNRFNFVLKAEQGADEIWQFRKIGN